MELFNTPLTFEKTAYIRVSENPAEWTRDVMEQFYNSFPYFMSFPVRVEFKQRDEQKGYAVGAIHIENGSGLSIPIIIKNRELYPFDTAFYQGTVLPLNEYTIQTYLSGKSPFQRTVPRETGDMSTLLFNAGSMGYTRESSMETYKSASVVEGSLLDEVLPNTSAAEREAFLVSASDERVAEGYKQNGTANAILKIASATADHKEEPAQERARVLLDRDIWYIYKKAEFEYRGIFGNSKIDDPIEFEMNDIEARQLGTLVKTSAVMNKTANDTTCAVASLPIANSDRTLVVLNNNDYISINNLDAKPFEKLSSASASTINVGDYGTFELHDGLYAEPFQVNHIIKEGATTHIHTSSALTKTAFALNPNIDSTYTENGVTWLPVDRKFVKLGKCVPANKGEMRQPKNKVIKTAGGFVVSGTELGQYVKTSEPIELHKAAWALVQCGSPEDNVTKLAAMREGDVLYILDELQLPASNIEKIAAEYNAEMDKAAKEVKAISRNFVKEASVVPDMPTIDKVLALNFVNKDTIGTFIQALPTLEDAMFRLADMLVKARIGVEILEEGAIRKLMFGLSDVIQVLKGVSTLKGDK